MADLPLKLVLPEVSLSDKFIAFVTLTWSSS